jgi:hypothetical protein
MAHIAGIRNSKHVRLCGRDELECVCANVHISDRLLDLRHVASDALISWAIGLVMCMGFDARSVRTIGCVGAVTVQAYLGRRLPEDRLIGRAMNVVATEARNAARIHQTLYEVVALHAVLVGCSIGKVSE